MPRVKHSVEQILHKLREADVLIGEGKKVSELCRKWSITEQTYYRWRSQYGGMKSDEAKRLRDLEIENQKLKEMLAEAELDKRILKEALEGNY